MKKVLIVEDDKALQRVWKAKFVEAGLDKEVTVVQAFTISEARQALNDHPDLDLIALDGNIENPLDGVEFAEHLDVWHEKLSVLAMSSYEDVRQMMQKAGCKYECEKEHVFPKIVSILGISL